MHLKNCKNTELVDLCAQEPWNRKAWLEFYNRFDERIWLVIYRECKALGIIKQDAQFQETVKDLVQDVYVKLTDNNCRALKNFVGASENSIYTYLGIIAKNVVRNYHIKISAQKRPSSQKLIDDAINISERGEKILVRDVGNLSYSGVEEEFSIVILKEEIDEILDKILKSKDKDRNKLIFKLYFYEGFSAEEIASRFKFNLSAKRIRNLVTEIKKKLRQELLERRMFAY